MAWTWSIIQVFVNLFQVYMMYKIFDIFYERRFKFKYSVEVVISISTFILCMINFNYQISTNAKLFIGYYLLSIILNIILFKGNPLSKIFTFFLVIAFIGTSELLSTSLIWVTTNIDFKTIATQGLGRFLAIILSQIFLLIIYLIIRKTASKEKYKFSNNKYNILVSFILFITVAIIITVIWMYGNLNIDDILVKDSLVLLTLCVAILAIFSIALTSKIINDIEEKHKLDLELQHIKFEHMYFSDVNSALEELRILRHDMRGELAIIHGYNELNQRDKIRNHIEKKLKDLDIQILPKMDDDNVITSFVNFKYKEAVYNNINVSIQSNITADKEIFIDKDDICRILNNILNNAIDANKECSDKYIKLNIHIINDYLIIKCENPYNGEIITEGGSIRSTKKDKRKHGYGLKSVKALTEKNNGFTSITFDNNVFTVDVQMLNKA